MPPVRLPIVQENVSARTAEQECAEVSAVAVAGAARADLAGELRAEEEQARSIVAQHGPRFVPASVHTEDERRRAMAELVAFIERHPVRLTDPPPSREDLHERR